MKTWSKSEFEAFVAKVGGRGQKQSRDNSDRAGVVLDGNNIRTLIYNYGSIGRPNTEPSLEWPALSGHGYAYEIGILVGAEVVDVNCDTLHIISDGMLDGGDYDPTGGANWWGWEPLPGYNRPGSGLALSNDPTTWPDDWATWPGLLGDSAIADQESFFVMDDRYNAEFQYYPMPQDSSIRGIGIEVRIRSFQWNKAFAQDLLIFHYTVKNVSDYPLEKVVVGMIGDPHIGGAGDFADDYAGFVDRSGYDSYTGVTHGNVRNLVYAFDNEGPGNDYGVPWEDLGWLGFQLLESPGDGIYSFHAPMYGVEEANQDELIWDRLTSITNQYIIQDADNILIFSVDQFSLSPGDSAVVALALVMGTGRDNIFRESTLARLFYDHYFHQQTEPDSVEFIAPVPDEVVSGIYSIQWPSYLDGRADSAIIDLAYNARDGRGSQILATGLPSNAGGFEWDTATLPDGYNYILSAIAHDDTNIYWLAQSEYFIVNNEAVEADPEIIYLGPKSKTMSGEVEISWRAGDADGDSVNIDIHTGYLPVATGEPNDGSYLWNTIAFPNADRYRLRLTATDGIISVFAYSQYFKLENSYATLDTTAITHIAGEGAGWIRGSIIDADSLTGHTYQITFDSSSYVSSTYNVYDLNRDAFVVEDATLFTPDMAGPYFDGLRLIVDNQSLQLDSSGWQPGANTNLIVTISYALGGDRYPVDYQVIFYDDYVDSSVIVNPQPVNFLITNTTDNLPVDFVFFDNDTDGIVSHGDEIRLLTPDIHGTWSLDFSDPEEGNPIYPGGGDTLIIKTIKPFSYRDIFELKSPAPLRIDPDAPPIPAEYSLSQNYPNPFNPVTTLKFGLPEATTVSLVVYDILGREVVCLVDDVRLGGFNEVQWPGQDAIGRQLPSGIYIARLVTPEYTKSIKMLLLK